MAVLRCAVIGLGMIGHEQVKIRRSLPQVELAVVCDLRAAVRERYSKQGLIATQSVAERLGTPGS